MESLDKIQDCPVITVALGDLVGWSMDRTSHLPKSQRFTFGQRLDGLSLDALQLSEPKSRMLSTQEGVPFCGFRFFPSLRPRILGATKRRFESRMRRLFQERNFKAAGVSVFAWYQFSREGNSEGLRRSYVRRSWGKTAPH